MNEQLIIEFNEKYNFNKVTCSEGHYITKWDKIDIKDYTASTVMYCPVTVDLSAYYCVPEDEHIEYMRLHREEMEKDREEMRNKNTTVNVES